jgi:hypothetical protein
MRAEADLGGQLDHERGPGQLGAPGLDRGEGDQTGTHRERRHRAVRIVCRYILMYAMSIRRVNPTDFDGHPNSQEKPEIVPVDRLRVTTKRGDSTCP